MRKTIIAVVAALGIGLFACAAPEEEGDATSSASEALSAPQARCTMQSLPTCAPAPDSLCFVAERLDSPGTDAAGCAFLRDVNRCMCPAKARPPCGLPSLPKCPTPPPAPIFVCNPQSPAMAVLFDGKVRACRPEPSASACALYDHGVPLAARPPQIAGCVRQGGVPGVGTCWCPIAQP